jgi:hypothetical protein
VALASTAYYYPRIHFLRTIATPRDASTIFEHVTKIKSRDFSASLEHERQNRLTASRVVSRQKGKQHG